MADQPSDRELLISCDSLLSLIRYREPRGGLSEQTIRDLDQLLPALRHRTKELTLERRRSEDPIMRTFHLQRDEDVTGISGTGVVAEGVEFSDGTCVLRWVIGEHRSTVVWPSIESVEAIHGHGGATKVVIH